MLTVALSVGIAGLAVAGWWKVVAPMASLLELSEDLAGMQPASRPDGAGTLRGERRPSGGFSRAECLDTPLTRPAP
jgi:hypothetical protein